MTERKTQILVSTDEETRSRLDALRIVTKVSRARVADEAWRGNGIKGIERKHADELRKVEALAARAGVSVVEYTARYARAFSNVTYGPGIEALNADDRAVTGARKVPALIEW